MGILQVFENIAFKYSYLAKTIADGGCRGEHLANALKATLGCDLEVVLRPDECTSKIQVVP
ncbi:MAG: hypothetical protein IKP81_11475 [Paludibacteraceae bacterium]|nr:hypothetical protein [Paludibacteraceae bacterium]